MRALGRRRVRRFKSQSAMEYLMTYGWAILIIAVVLGALYSLGIFNSTNFAPKAPPGSCQVFRPNGPYTTSFINLEGVCNGELPEYVANFNGQSSYITASSGVSLSSAGSMSAWVYATNWVGNSMIIGSVNNVPAELLTNSPGILAGYVTQNSVNTVVSSGYTLPTNKWLFVVMTFSSSGINFYVNGNEVYTSSTATSGGSFTPLIGWDSSAGTDFWDGNIADAQIYNTSLSQAEITALYQEGIGGAPIDLQNLVAWYPLNGDANDYSGNGNNGVPSNVMFVGNWYSSYTPP